MVSNKIWIWSITNVYPQKLIGEYDKKSSISRLQFMKGEVIKNPGFIDITFDCDCSELINRDILFHNGGGIPLVSKNIADALNEHVKGRIQLISVNIKCKDNAVLGYFLVNVITLEKIIDTEKSEYSCVPTTNLPLNFSKIAVFENKVNQIHIGRDVLFQPTLFISDQLVEKMQISSRNNLVFRTVESHFSCEYRRSQSE